MTYAGTGVDYGSMDPFKQAAQEGARQTDDLIERLGAKVIPWTRGESVFVVRTSFGYLGMVVEGLGTKSLVADTSRSPYPGADPETYYQYLAWCNVAMAVNDLSTLGFSPLIYGQYVAAGDSRWFKDRRRSEDLVRGTVDACQWAGCVWGGGETPTLQDIINPKTVDLAGATVGIMTDHTRLINPANIRAGDQIIMVASSGIHANGLTMARKIAEQIAWTKESRWRRNLRRFRPQMSPSKEALFEAYQTDCGGKSYAKALLAPTIIYSPLVERLLDRRVDLRYVVNVTGHGWRKLMRAPQPFRYVIDTMPPHQSPVFDFIQQHGNVTDEEMYGNFNMGAGYALYVPPGNVEMTLRIAEECHFNAWLAGSIEEGAKSVVINPKGLVYKTDTLAVR